MISHRRSHGQLSNHTRKTWLGQLKGCLILMGIFLVSMPPFAHADSLNISDSPLETRTLSAPPNVMFVLDNSGSMDWEFMTDQAEGKFEGNIEYLFDDPGDNNYQSGSNSDILSGSDRGKWKSQWAGYNMIFFNPTVDYQPWPNMADADTTTPRSNPANASPTFDLTAEYHSITSDIIVDNQDAPPYFTTTGTWPESVFNPEWEYSSFYTDTVGATATFAPVLPQGGTYEVYAWWNCFGNRDDNAQITIVHNSGTDIVYKNQRATTDNTPEPGICGEWILLGSYNFDAGLSGSVTIERHAGSTGATTVADAIKFSVPSVPGPISIKNAHYYTWDDANGNGQLDSGEDVYLVNFVGGIREYYRVQDTDGDDIVESGELIPIAELDLPDSARPKVYDEEGTFVRYKTDAEDLQNFANWYSYFRRRELTAKAAVSNVIRNLAEVQVGFYSINTGLRQAVLPIKVDMGLSVIVDNRDSGYAESGTWRESGASNEYNGSSRYTRNAGDDATWTPDLPQTGTYNVYGWWDYYSTRDTNALYTINHASGTATMRVNQKQNYSQWTLLGTYDFDAGTSGYVRVTRDGSSTGSSTSADAVMFELVGGTAPVDETDTLLNNLYAMDSDGSTPLRSALRSVGRYFHQDDGYTGGLGASPYATDVDGGACQQAFTIVMTDGYYNGSAPSVGNQDGDQGTPYADTYSNTLADVAMQYYKEDLSSGLADEVPTNSCDNANHQHMVTYSVSFGVTGTLTPLDSDGDGIEDDPCFLDSSTPVPSWPNPQAGDQQKIDDLWHTAVNGRGTFYSASNPEELIDALVTLFKSIASRTASGASVSVNGEELNANTVLYQASFNTSNWTGDLTAYPIDPTTGAIKRLPGDILWQASDMLQTISWDNRNIVTYDGTTGGLSFRYDSLTSGQKTALDPGWSTDPTLAQNILEYLRGREITGFRPRIRKLGDIVHSAPLLVGNTIFAGGNDGMLHAFDAQYGTERFAYVPNLVFDNLKLLKENSYDHRFYVDLTPVAVAGVGPGNITLMVGGLGKGGKGFYALDVTNADSVDTSTLETSVAAMVLWEYPRAGTTDDDIGYTFSKALIVKSYSSTDEWVIILGNGYDSTNGRAVLYVLDIDGNLITKIDTGVGGSNGLSTPSLVDVDNDLKVDYVYAGDLNGNLWKFDLTDSDPANWAVAYDDGIDPMPLFQTPGQPITTKPDVMDHCDKDGYMVVFGTGKYLTVDDRTDTTVQSFYGIWDYGDDNDSSEYLGAFNKATGELSNQPTGVTLLEQTEIDWRWVSGHNLRTLSDNAPLWETIDDADAGQNPNPGALGCSDGVDDDGDGTTDEADECPAHAGWYFDLPIAGERVIKDLLIRDGKAIIISSIPSDSPCAGGGDSIVHEIDACTGARLSEAQFDINNDGVVDDYDLINIGTVDDPVWVAPSGKMHTGILHPPVILSLPDGETELKVFSSSAGVTESLFEAAEKRGIVYWIER